jgi:cytochrome c biogenesis protein CcmG/thiol:disulfide interchange protein DsbE
MATKSPRSGKPNRAQAIRRAQQRRYPVLPIVVGGIVFIAIVAIIAAVLSGGGDDKGDDNGVAQTRSVKVEGTALGQFDDSPANDPAIGATAPTLIGQNFAGKRVTIGNDGKAKAILFVAHWCPHCQAEIPRVADYLKQQGLPAGVELFIVPTSTSPQYPNYPPQTWLDREGLGNVPTLVDDDQNTAHGAYGNGGFPNLVLVSANGKVAARFSGELGEAAYPVLLDALAKGTAIPGTSEGGSSATPSP